MKKKCYLEELKLNVSFLKQMNEKQLCHLRSASSLCVSEQIKEEKRKNCWTYQHLFGMELCPEMLLAIEPSGLFHTKVIITGPLRPLVARSPSGSLSGHTFLF